MIIIVQIVVGLYAIYSAIENLEKVSYEKEKIEQFFESDKIYTLNFTEILEPSETKGISEIGEEINRKFLKVEDIEGLDLFTNIFLYNTVKSKQHDYQNENAEIMYLDSDIIENII